MDRRHKQSAPLRTTSRHSRVQSRQFFDVTGCLPLQPSSFSHSLSGFSFPLCRPTDPMNSCRPIGALSESKVREPPLHTFPFCQYDDQRHAPSLVSERRGDGRTEQRSLYAPSGTVLKPFSACFPSSPSSPIAHSPCRHPTCLRYDNLSVRGSHGALNQASPSHLRSPHFACPSHSPETTKHSRPGRDLCNVKKPRAFAQPFLGSTAHRPNYRFGLPSRAYGWTKS